MLAILSVGPRVRAHTTPRSTAVCRVVMPRPYDNPPVASVGILVTDWLCTCPHNRGAYLNALLAR